MRVYVRRRRRMGKSLVWVRARDSAVAKSDYLAPDRPRVSGGSSFGFERQAPGGTEFAKLCGENLRGVHLRKI